MPDEVVQTPFGKFLVNDRDLIESTLKAGTLWDGPGFLQPIAIEHGGLGDWGTTILDVGANVGAFSVWLARRGAWRVVAVEPVPQTYQRLLANLDLNRDVTADCVIHVPVAAYSHPVDLALAQPYDPTNQGGATLVRQEGGPTHGQPLDQYAALFGRRVSLVKLDVQGCELRVLYGLTGTIVAHRPVVVFEWEADLATAHGDSWMGVRAFFTDRDYRLTPWPGRAHDYLAIPKERA